MLMTQISGFLKQYYDNSTSEVRFLTSCPYSLTYRPISHIPGLVGPRVYGKALHLAAT